MADSLPILLPLLRTFVDPGSLSRTNPGKVSPQFPPHLPQIPESGRNKIKRKGILPEARSAKV
jgi:hypothetical protein